MAFQSVPECAVASVQCSLNGVPYANVLNFRALSGSYNQASIDNLALGVAAWWLGEMIPQLQSAIVALQVVVRGLEFVNDITATQDMSATPGTGSGVPVPNNVAFAVKFTSGLTGRSARGRMYISGFAANLLDSTERFINSTYRDSLVGAVSELADAVDAAGWQHVIVSRYSGGVKRPTGVWFPVTGYSTTDLRIDTMRRRLGSA